MREDLKVGGLLAWIEDNGISVEFLPGATRPWVVFYTDPHDPLRYWEGRAKSFVEAVEICKGKVDSVRLLPAVPAVVVVL